MVVVECVAGSGGVCGWEWDCVDGSVRVCNWEWGNVREWECGSV